MSSRSPLTNASAIGEFWLPRPVAYVFSGGASSGAMHVGMLRAVEKSGLRPDLVVGTSVGALHGAHVATNNEQAADALQAIWHDIGRGDVFPRPGFRQIAKMVSRRRHICSSDALARLIGRHIPVTHIEHLELPFAAVTASAADGRSVPFTHGDLGKVLLASSAVPGVFPRVEIDGHWYIDGGVAANVPINTALRLGARSLVVFDATSWRPGHGGPTTITETFRHIAGLFLHRQLERDLQAVPEMVPVVHLHPASPLAVSPFDFTKTRELIELGHRSAADVLRRARASGEVDVGGRHQVGAAPTFEQDRGARRRHGDGDGALVHIA